MDATRGELLDRLAAKLVVPDDMEGAARGSWATMNLATLANAAPVAERQWHLQDPLVRLQTSGTTGEPEVVTLLAGQLLFGAMGTSLRLGHLPGDRWLGCLPLHHIGGLAILVRAALTGASVELLDGFEPRRVHGALARGDVSLVSMVPEMLRQLLAIEARPRWPGLRAVLLGGAACDPELLERARQAELPIALTWGMTESAAQVATGSPHGATDPWLPPSAFARVGTDATGRLFITGPQAPAGHYVTGDRGAIEEGLVRVDGRVDGVICSGALRLDPAAIREALLAIDGVEQAHVVGRDDARWGARPVAALVAREEPLDDDLLMTELRGRLSGPEIPDQWIWVDGLPRGPLGKISGAGVRGLFEEAQVNETASETRRHRDGLEGLEVHESVNLPGASSRDAVSDAHHLEGEGQRAGAQSLHGHLDRQPLSQAHGPLEVRVGVDEGHPPSLSLEDRGPGGIDGQEELLEGLVNVLEHPTVESDASTVDLMETNSELVSESHGARSSTLDESHGVVDASSLEGTR